MILRRMGNAIAQQDWFVVLIELMVLVVGIFIGLLADYFTSRLRLRRLGNADTRAQFNPTASSSLFCAWATFSVQPIICCTRSVMATS